jgi:pyridoxine kinase
MIRGLRCSPLGHKTLRQCCQQHAHAQSSLARPKNVLSIQSHVVFGHAGNSAATFPMRRLGVNVWPLNTVQYSNHTQYPEGFEGLIIPGEQISLVADGIEAIGELSRCDAVLSGYIGSAAQGKLILEVVAKIKALNPNAIYCCDPVMGSPEKGCIVPEDVTNFLAESALVGANIISPNILELEQITKRKLTSVDEAISACQHCLESTPQLELCFVKHLSYAAIDKGCFEMLLVSKDGDAWHISTPLLPFEKPPVGVGDLTSGMFLANYLQGKSPVECLEATTASYFAVMEATHELGEYELQLVAAQDRLVAPERTFTAQKLR